jgi:hypothetical protein
MELANLLGIIGVLISNLLGLRIGISYWKSRLGLIHEYNQYLFYLSFASCINWIYYGILTHDIYVFASCIITVITTFGFIQMLYHSIQTDSDKFKLAIIESGCLTMLSLWLSLIGLEITEQISLSQATQIMGWVASSISVTKNFSPCLVIGQIIKSGDPTLIYFPQAFLGFVNLAIWVGYSIAIGDIFQIVSNGLSALVCLLQLIVWGYYKFKYDLPKAEDQEQVQIQRQI